MSRFRLSPGLLFVMLTLGYGLVHLVCMLWVGTLLQPLWTGTATAESIQITKDGEVLIQRNTRQAGETWADSLEYYRLDDTRVSPDQIPTEFMNLVTASTSPLGSKTVSVPPWGRRLVPIEDRGTPPTYWYLEVSAEDPQRLCFVGFNSLSRQKTGFVGRKGFTPNPVAPADRFLIPWGDSYNLWIGAVASSHAQHWFYQDVYEPVHQQRSAPRFANVEGVRLWILSEGTVYEIDLSQRQVKPLLQSDDAIALYQTEANRDGRRLLQLLLRTPEELRIIDPRTLAETRLPLPLQPPPCTGSVYGEANNGERIILSYFRDRVDPSQPYSCEIQWFQPDGKLIRTETRTLATMGDIPISFYNVYLAVPTPLVPFIGLAIGPSAMAWDGDPRDYATRFRRMFDLTGTWLLVALAIGITCGFACRRREVRIYGNRSWLWPIVVGLCGWFGWIGYICVRPLPARLPDGTYLTRIPEPALATGYEILA